MDKLKKKLLRKVTFQLDLNFDEEDADEIANALRRNESEVEVDKEEVALEYVAAIAAIVVKTKEEPSNGDVFDLHLQF